MISFGRERATDALCSAIAAARSRRPRGSASRPPAGPRAPAARARVAGRTRGAREGVPRAGEREEARAAAVAVRGEHRADAAVAVGVGADDDRVLADAVEHGPPRALRQPVDCGLQPGDRVARPAPHGPAG